jgi:dihydroorotase
VIAVKKLLLINAHSTEGHPINVEITGSRISAIIDPRSQGELSNFSGEVFDCGGKVLSPSFIDLHTHLREPGKEDAETVDSGLRAAVAGGFGVVSAMPNTSPVADTAGVVEQVFALGQEANRCDLFPIGAVTQGLEGKKLAEILAMAHSKANVRMFSDDGNCVSDSLLMRRALEYVKIFDGVIAQHAQDPSLTIDAQINEGALSARLGLKGWPAVAEEAIIARDVLLADHVNSRLHICHVSTAGSVEIIRWAKERGIKVSAEVTPHHLLLNQDLLSDFDPIYKVNPPLRTQSDVEALREGLADGTIDVIATDHAPHPMEAKECEFNSAAFGMTGLESAFAIGYQTMVKTSLISLSSLVASMSSKAAVIGGYSEYENGLMVNGPASLVLIDLSKSWIVDREKSNSKSRNTPYHGLEFEGVITDLLYRGEWVLRDSQVIS